jgi:hypothetical protein
MRSFSVMAVAAVLSVPQASRGQDTWLPELVAPAPAVLETVTAPYLTDEERKDFRVLHGISDDLDLDALLGHHGLGLFLQGRLLDLQLVDV